MRFGYITSVKTFFGSKTVSDVTACINQTLLQVWMAYLLGTYLLQRLVILTTASISDVWRVMTFHGFEEDGLKLAFHRTSGG